MKENIFSKKKATMPKNDKPKKIMNLLRNMGFGLAFAALLVSDYIGLALFGMLVLNIFLFDYSLGLFPVGILGLVLGFVFGPKIFPRKVE
jgi:hypothetical protein